MGKYERRYKQILLSEEMFDELVNLPDHVRIVGTELALRRRGIRLIVESPEYEPVPECAEPPFTIISAHYHRDEDGTKRMKIEFPWEERK